MPIEVWFPLAVYYQDLAGSAEHNPRLARHVHALHAASGAKRTEENSSWTGDVHRVDRLHFDPELEWLTNNVREHAVAYLKALGYNLDKIAIHVQRAWPVIAKRGQAVARHAHYTAHLSAVYYVSAPSDGDAGQIRFYNDHSPNELSPGIGTSMTGGYAERNSFNYGSSTYDPVPGRLLLFPSKLTHSVAPNETDEERLSITFDLVLTSRGGGLDGEHEFLMPAPSSWRCIHGGGAEVAPEGLDAAKAQNLPADMTLLVATVSANAEMDDIALVDSAGHLLWETRIFPHCSSHGGWEQYAATIENLTPEDWSGDDAGALMRWRGVDEWKAYGDAVARLIAHLRQCDVPMAGAALSPPELQRRRGGGVAPFSRLQAPLGVYVRLDFEPDAPCRIEFADGESVPLAPGELALVSGVRRHRLCGASHVLHVQVEIPSLARRGLMRDRLPHDARRLDAQVFDLLTALPLQGPTPSLDQIAEKRRRMAARARRRARSDLSPEVRRYLKDHADPEMATPRELAAIRCMGGDPMQDARLVENVPVLSCEQCRILRDFADKHLIAVVADSVDDLPEYQLNVTAQMLTGLLGEDVAECLLRLPEYLGAPAAPSPDRLYRHVDAFIRVYAINMRQFIPFHHDTCDFTVNVALNDDAEYQGGDLLVLFDHKLRAVGRRKGAAVLHAGNVVHGVSSVQEGKRYSLILFFHQGEGFSDAAGTELDVGETGAA